MLAIVLVNYNGEKDTVECIKSISASEKIELPFIILVDNNSKNRLCEKDVSFYPRIKIIDNHENVGFGRANNIGIKWALENLNTDFIFILNNDTIVEKDSVYKLITNFPDSEDTVLVSPKILTREKHPKIWYGGGYFNYKRISVNVCNIGEPNRDLSNRYVEFASGCAMLFRSKYLASNSAFDEQFFMYEEDLELCMRIIRQKKLIYFVGSSAIYHKCQGSQEEASKKHVSQLHPCNPNLQFYLSLTISNRYYIINKHFDSLERLYRKVTLTTYWLSKSVQYLMFGKLKASLFTLRRSLLANRGIQ